MDIFINMPRLAGRTHITKDLAKIKIATKFIGRGATGSSTHIYFNIFNERGLANLKDYTSEDLVFISVNGKRQAAKTFNKDLVDRAIKAKAKIVCDNEINRSRDYNIGERQLYHYLTVLNGYKVLVENEFYCILHKV